MRKLFCLFGILIKSVIDSFIKKYENEAIYTVWLHIFFSKHKLFNTLFLSPIIISNLCGSPLCLYVYSISFTKEIKLNLGIYHSINAFVPGMSLYKKLIIKYTS